MSYTFSSSQATFSSGLGTVHIINHSINQLRPFIVCYDQLTNKQVFPTEVEIITANQIKVTLSVASDIYGRII